MADGSVKIEVGLDVGKAEKKLANLKDKISKAEDQLNKTSGQRDAISERLDNAAKKAEAARQKIAELNEELNKGSDPMAKPQDTKEIQAMIQKRNQLVEEMRKIDTTATRALQEDINRAKGEQAGYQSHLEKIEDRAARLGISPDKYAKEVDKIKSTKLQPLEERIAQLSSQLDIMRQASGEASLSSQIRDLDRRIGLERQKAAEATGAPSAEEAQKINAQIVEQQKLIKDAEKEAEKLKTEFEKVDEKVKDGEKDLEDMKSQAGQMVDAIEKARPGEALARGLEQARKSMWKFLKYALGIRSVFFLWKRLRQYISDAVKLYAQYDEETKYNLSLMEATKKATQAAFGSAFAQVYTSILPVVQKIANWMLTAANAAARFIAIISGRGSYKKAVVSTAEVAASLEDAAGSAKEIQKSLAPIDELNILGSDAAGSGGAGGGTATDGIDYIEESLDALEDTFLDRLALSVKDVIFDWSDLNPEQIAEKAISGLSMLLGGVTGFMIGGVPGAIVGTLLGLTLSLIADSAIFDHDGVLNRDEIASMLQIALMGLCGGVIGFTVGGPAGALLGATIGVGYSLVAESIKASAGNESGDSFLSSIVEALNNGIVLGTAASVGFMVGGPGGAAIGALIGLGITFAIGKIKTKDDNASDKAKYKSKVAWFLCGVLGLPTDQEIIEFVEKIPGWIAEGLGNFAEELRHIFVEPFQNMWRFLFGESNESGENVSEGFLESAEKRWHVDEPLIVKPFKKLIQMLLDANKDTKYAGDTSISGWFKGMKERWNVGEPGIVTLFRNLLTKLKGVLGTNSTTSGMGLMGRTAISDLTTGMNSQQGLLSSAVNKIKGLLDFSWSFPKPKMPHFSWTWESVGGLFSIPRLYIDWYAKGGVFDLPSLIGVGEDGKEAVVPLEKNTEWMNLVADGLMDRLQKANFANQLADAFIRTPMPAMASGGIVPPGTLGYESIAESIGDAIAAAFKGAFTTPGDSKEIEQPIILQVDGEEMARTVLRYKRQFDRASG